MDIKWTVCALAVFLAACSEDSGLPENSLVFADRGVRQCESNGISPGASAQILINAGVDVLRSNCGLRTGVNYPALCGAGTADILVHQIRSVNMPHAAQLGFQDVRSLVDSADGTGYRLINCATRFPGT